MKDRIMNFSDQKGKRNELRQHATLAEVTLWRLLKGKSIRGLKFRRQHGVGPYILDFYCSELRLCIELDGESHCSKTEYDDNRTKYLNEIARIQVLRFENRVVLENPETILEKIEEIWLEHQSPSSAGTLPF